MANYAQPTAPAYNSVLQGLAQRSASPQTALDAQQNQMLAEQLSAAQQQGADRSTNPLAFAANLAAALIDKHRMSSSNQVLADDASKDQLGLENSSLATIKLPPMGAASAQGSAAASSSTPSPQALGAALSGDQPAAGGGAGQGVPTMGSPSMGAPGSAPSPPAAGMPAAAPVPGLNQTAQGPPQGFGGAAASAANAAARVGPPVTAQDRDALIRMVYGEARGEHPSGQAATAAVALNRSLMSGQPVSAVVSAPGQFEGLRHGLALDPGSPDYQRIAAVVDPLLSGHAQDPSGGATHFWSPGAQAALGRQAPPWANGQQGRQIGNQMFYSLPFGGHGAPQGQAAGAPAGQEPQLPAPQTIAPAGPQATPHTVYGSGPSDQEQAIVRQLLASPYQAMRDQGLQMIAGIRQRMLSPVDYDQKFDPSTGQTVYIPKTPGQGPVQYAAAPQGYQRPAPDKMMYGPDGVLHPLAGTTESAPVRVSPQATAQADPFGHVSYSAVPGLAGDAPAGTAWDGSAYKSVPGASYSADPTSPIQRAPNGKAEAMPGTWTPEQLLSMRSKFYDSDAFKKYGEALSAFQGLRGVLGQMKNNSGVYDTAAIDSYLRGINPGMGARNTTVTMFLNHLGLPQEIAAHISSITGNGYLTPQTLDQMQQVIQSYTAAHYAEASKLRQSDMDFAKQHGMGDPGEALEAPPGLVPVPGAGGGRGAAPGGAAAGVTLQAVQAELARRRAMAAGR